MVTLVTGGNGFVASNIVRVLAERGHRVVSLDISEPDGMLMAYLQPWRDRITFHTADVLDLNALDELACEHSIDKVVHAVAYTPGSRGPVEHDYSRSIVEVNVMGTVNLLDLARRISVQRFLFVSSGAVYEGVTAPRPLNEETFVHPKALYRISKYACERIAERYRELHGLDTVSVRLGGPYGPMERVTGYRANMSLLHDWTGQAVRGEPIEVMPQPPGDYTYVLDIASGLATVLDAPHLPHRLYNMARGVATPTSRVVDALREAYPAAKFVEPVPPDPASDETPHVDVSRMREDFGFEATTDVLSGLKDYFKWRAESGYTG